MGEWHNPPSDEVPVHDERYVRDIADAIREKLDEIHDDEHEYNITEMASKVLKISTSKYATAPKQLYSGESGVTNVGLNDSVLNFESIFVEFGIPSEDENVDSCFLAKSLYQDMIVSGYTTSVNTAEGRITFKFTDVSHMQIVSAENDLYIFDVYGYCY